MSTDYIKKVLTQSHQGLSITKEAKESIHELVYGIVIVYPRLFTQGLDFGWICNSFLICRP